MALLIPGDGSQQALALRAGVTGTARDGLSGLAQSRARTGNHSMESHRAFRREANAVFRQQAYLFPCPRVLTTWRLEVLSHVNQR
jgi:hypothetical protein